jgi:hypothetical protein
MQPATCTCAEELHPHPEPVTVPCRGDGLSLSHTHTHTPTHTHTHPCHAASRMRRHVIPRPRERGREGGREGGGQGGREGGMAVRPPSCINGLRPDMMDFLFLSLPFSLPLSLPPPPLLSLTHTHQPVGPAAEPDIPLARRGRPAHPARRGPGHALPPRGELEWEGGRQGRREGQKDRETARDREALPRACASIARRARPPSLRVDWPCICRELVW